MLNIKPVSNLTSFTQVIEESPKQENIKAVRFFSQNLEKRKKAQIEMVGFQMMR
ncbi:MAG: hypothetical protein K6E27_03230 [Eubacterium sp.]|nr:hypothetical protein [Eubacterium sp.]